MRTPTPRWLRRRQPPAASPLLVLDPPPVAEWHGRHWTGLRGTGDLHDLPTEAPRVGNLRPAPVPTLKAATPLRVPSVVMDGLQVGDHHLAAASHAGTSHLHHGTCRQDSYDFVVTTTGRLVVAIADGLGSRAYSQLGARLFGEQVVQLALEAPDWPAEWYLAAAADRAGAVAAASYGVPMRDIGFVGAVAVFSGGTCTVARVGDVSAFARTAHGDFCELFADDGGSMNMVSVSLPGPATPEVVHTDADRVVLTTDGMAGDIRHSASVRRWLAHRWSGPVTAWAMSDALRFRRQGSHDDRTAVVVWR